MPLALQSPVKPSLKWGGGGGLHDYPNNSCVGDYQPLEQMKAD